MASEVRVTGLREFVASCERLGISIDDLRDAFAEVARLGAETAAAFAPKRTGTLAGDIRGNRSKSKAVVSAGRATVPYAGPINYGWPRHGIVASNFMQKTDAVWQPFALDRLKHEIDLKIEKEGLE